MKKTIRGALMAIGLGLLAIIIVWVTRDQTVDFSGTVKEIAAQEDMIVITITDAFENTYPIYADKNTMYRKYKGPWIPLEDVAVGDMISGNYRLFHKDRAGQVEVIDR